MPRKWSRAAQIALERPREPLTRHCAVHRAQRTTIRVQAGWWCLACRGCPRCGVRQVWEQIEQDDAGLSRDPIWLEGRAIRGDWWCLVCWEWLVRWTEWRRAMRSWRAGLRARAEGYKRGAGPARDDQHCPPDRDAIDSS